MRQWGNSRAGIPVRHKRELFCFVLFFPKRKKISINQLFFPHQNSVIFNLPYFFSKARRRDIFLLHVQKLRQRFVREERYWAKGRKQRSSEQVFLVLGSLGKFSTSLKDRGNEAESNTAHCLAKMLHPLSNSTSVNLANCLCDLLIKRKHNSPTETHRINRYFTCGRGGGDAGSEYFSVS